MPSDKRLRKKQGREARLAELRAQEAKARLRKRIIAGAVVAALIVAVAFLSSRGGDDDKVTAGASTTASSTSTTAAAGEGPPKGEPVPPGAKLDAWKCPEVDGSSPRTDQFPAEPPPQCIDKTKTVVAKVTTTEGVMEYTLDSQKAPIAANNFAVLSRYHYYDGTVITRIADTIDIFQTGSPRTQTIGDPGPGYTLPDEGSDFKYTEGDVVMARSSAGSSAAQYFVVVGPKASGLDRDGSYITFARVTSGMDVAKKIFALFQPCAAGDSECSGGAPSKIVTVQKVEIEER
ncbi:MAG TPA: peptidylprolyl isomerase [Acidimicrobiales bacterium]|nr:peptidylprolyl isomerase [Acidimicrobiales bacterium]